MKVQALRILCAFLAMGLCWALTPILIGIDDSMLTPTTSVKKGRNITTSNMTQEVLSPKGVGIDVHNFHNPLSLLMETPEEIKQRYPFVECNETNVLQVRGMYTHIPVSYIYDHHIKRAMKNKKKAGDIVQALYFTVRGYATKEQIKRIASSALENEYAVKTAVLMSDATALALQVFTSRPSSEYVQVYVFRDKMVVASLFRFTPETEKDGIKIKQPITGTLKNIYHESYDIYNELEILGVISEGLQDRVLELVEQRWKTKSVKFFPQMHREKTGPKENPQYFFNIVQLVNKTVLELNANFFAEQLVIDVPSLELLDEKGEVLAVVLPNGEKNLVLDITQIRDKIKTYIEEKKEKIREITEKISKKNTELGLEKDPQMVVYNNLFTPDLFLSLIKGSGIPEDATKMGKSKLSEGLLLEPQFKIRIEDSTYYVYTKPNQARFYEINGRQVLPGKIEELLKEEKQMKQDIISLITLGAVKEEGSSQRLTEKEKEEIKKKIKNLIAVPNPDSPSPKPEAIVQAVREYKKALEEAKSREYRKKEIEKRILRIEETLQEGANLKDHASPECPDLATEIETKLEETRKKLETLKAEKSEDPKHLKTLGTLDNSIGYAILCFRKTFEAHLERKERLEAKEKEKQEKEKQEKEKEAAHRHTASPLALFPEDASDRKPVDPFFRPDL